MEFDIDPWKAFDNGWQNLQARASRGSRRCSGYMGRNGAMQATVDETHNGNQTDAAAHIATVALMRGPASPHLIAPRHFSVEVLRAIASAASLPHQRWDLRDRRCPGRLGPTRKSTCSSLPPVTRTPDRCTGRSVACGMPGPGGGPRLPPPDDSPAPHAW